MFIKFNFMYIMMFIMFISLMMMLFNNLFSMLKKKMMQKNLPYECGFDFLSKPSLPFSLPFYLMTLLFLIFDAEIILLMPIIFILNINSNFYINIFLYMFLFFMTFILILEWMYGYLNWLY